jgi:YcaO-like protein with predicted kinase domain
VKLDLGGTFRGRDAAATLAWVQPMLPRLGITRLANVTGLDRIGIPVWLCVRPNARSLSVSQGKGVTAELAQASAVMESIEVYHAEHLPSPDLVASYDEVRRGCDVVSPRALEPGIRWSLYDDDRPIGWIGGTDLASGARVLVPHGRLSLDWSRPHPDAGLFLASSTGLASGNELSEALCHAIFEAVERDAEWHWRELPNSAQNATRLDAATVETPMLRHLLQQFAEAGLLVDMWDQTSGVGIPVYLCTITDPGAVGIVDGYSGSGCHLSNDIALARALTEAAQSRLTFIAGSRDDTFPEAYEPHPPRVPEDADGRVDFRVRQSACLGRTFDEDLDTTLQLLRAAGFPRVVWVDHTRPEFGVPVVSVLVPGLRECLAD